MIMLQLHRYRSTSTRIFLNIESILYCYYLCVSITHLAGVLWRLNRRLRAFITAELCYPVLISAATPPPKFDRR